MAGTWQLTTEPLRSLHRDRVDVRIFRVSVESGPDRGTSITSTTDRLAVGTHEAAQLRLTDRAVSRFHCELAIERDAVVLTDLNSRNGTHVDGVPVRVAPLRDGAVIEIGASRLRFTLEAQHAAIPLSSETRFGRVLGVAPATRAVIAQLAKLATTDTTVLLEGETGTGKELAAEALHTGGSRREHPFLVVDCGAIPPELLEAELFGYEAGAFTGATERRLGVFEAARGGTVLLDEIGELALDLQPKLLRALEAREVKRLGDSVHRSIDVRVVAATHRDLRSEVNAQRFRSDLFYRLAVVQVRLPPLRERVEDIPLLVDTMLADLGALDSAVVSTLRSTAGRQQLAAHRWPGNARELRNYVERCVALGTPVPPQAASALPPSVGEPEPLKVARERAVRVFEHAYLTELLARCNDNVTAAARVAGVDRIHLYRLLWRHGLRVKDD